MRYLTSLALVLMLAISGACGTDADRGSGADECDDTDAACAPEAQPLPEPSREDYDTVETKNGRYRLTPISSPVKEDIQYEFSIHTHCGLDVAVVDFDGSFWDYVGPGTGNDGSANPPRGFDNPSDLGTMTLVYEERAEFESSMGEPAYFERHEGAKTFPGCD